MRFASFLPLYNRILIRRTTLPAYPRTTRLPRMGCTSFLPLPSRLSTLPTHSRTIRLPRMRCGFLPLSRSHVACLRRIRQTETQQEPTRHETNDFGSRYHESLLG